MEIDGKITEGLMDRAMKEDGPDYATKFSEDGLEHIAREHFLESNKAELDARAAQINDLIAKGEFDPENNRDHKKLSRFEAALDINDGETGKPLNIGHGYNKNGEKVGDISSVFGVMQWDAISNHWEERTLFPDARRSKK